MGKISKVEKLESLGIKKELFLKFPKHIAISCGGHILWAKKKQNFS